MADVLLPPHLRTARIRTRYIDSTGMSVGEFTGAKRTASKGGDRLGASLDIVPTGGKTSAGISERGSLISFLSKIRGRQNRIIATEDGYRRRGSLPSVELLSNNSFANGTAGFGASAATLSVADRVLRITSDGTFASSAAASAATAALTQYMPYVFRTFIAGGSMNTTAAGPYIEQSGAAQFNSSLGVPGYRATTIVPYVAGAGAVAIIASSNGSGYKAGDYASCPWASVSQCALVGNGPNYLLRSDELDNAAWPRFQLNTVVANTATAPDGTLTGEALTENSANSAHAISQITPISASALDYCFVVSLKAAERTWAFLVLQENTGSTQISAYCNLSTGAFGTTTVGANWSNLRTFSVNKGNGWFDFYIVGRKTNAATGLTAFIQMATANGTSSYTGDNASRILAWRATLAQSSVPTRLAQTTSSALSTGTAQTGGALYIKGLPASTSGLLLEGDLVEVVTSYGSELKRVTASLNSDAAGLGYLQFEPPLRGTPADNAAVIVHQPFGRFICMSDVPEWATEPGNFTTTSIDLEEA